MELLVTALLLVLAIASLVELARRAGIPYPVVLVLGGLGLAFVPGLPEIDLQPDLVLLLFLPPLLFSAAFETSWRDLRRDMGPVARLAIGLVVFTMLVVAVIAHAAIPGLPWAAAFALGAIVSPTDALAATTVFERLHVPRRLVTVLEGESLFNDATALVAWRTAVLAAIGGAFVPSEALGTFVVAVIGGIAIGLAVGLLFTVVLDRLENPPVEVALSLVIPYAAYLPSVQAGLSGVLAAVVAGLVIGRRSATILSPDTRLLALGAWETVRFLLNGFAFILVGLQLPTILGGLSARGPTELLGIAAAVTTGVVLARFAWVFATGYLLPRSLIRSLERTQPELRLPVALIASWAGLRGAVSLAAALALPAEFPERNLLILVTFAVILATLVGQGLTLPLLLRRMELPSAAAAEAEETRAREVVIGAGLAELDRIRPRWPTHQPLLDRLEAGLHDRRRHLSTEDPEETDERIQERLEHEEIQRGLIAAQRQAVIDLRDRGEIGDEVLRTIQRELDLEELRMEA